jgi:hypothetical protein
MISQSPLSNILALKLRPLASNIRPQASVLGKMVVDENIS